MEISLEELKAHLMATDPKFQELVAQHAQLKKRLDVIEAKEHLTLEDEDQEHEIKKQKLRLKDLMNQMLSHNRPQTV